MSADAKRKPTPKEAADAEQQHGRKQIEMELLNLEKIKHKLPRLEYKSEKQRFLEQLARLEKS